MNIKVQNMLLLGTYKILFISVGNHKRGLRFHAQNDLPYRGQNYFLSSIVQMLLESIVRKKKEKKKQNQCVQIDGKLAHIIGKVS
jgi:hypothetical protein